jgi:DNA-binding CsgD family transcriptional regulator
MLKYLSINSLDLLFSFLNSQSDTIFWIRSADYQRQIYVSPSFESICQLPCSQLYEHPESFMDYVITSQRKQFEQLIDKMVKKEAEFDGISMFKMISPGGDLACFKQTTFTLLNQQGEHVGFAGVGKHLPEEIWHQEFELWEQGEDKLITDPLKNHIIELLETEAKVVPSTLTRSTYADDVAVFHKGQKITLTPREFQCLKYLMQGYSAKQTAQVLNISPRTIECYLKNIKEKAECRTQLELLSKVVRLNPSLPILR